MFLQRLNSDAKSVLITCGALTLVNEYINTPSLCLFRVKEKWFFVDIQQLGHHVGKNGFYIPVFVTTVTVTTVALKVDLALVHLAGVDETHSRENRVRFLLHEIRWHSVFPGVQNLTHLKLHPPNNELFGVPGANIFVHLGVGGFVTERSVGVPDFQVCKTTHT